MLRKNLAGEFPKPVFFMPYLYEAEPPKPKVLIDVKSPGKEPLFYIKEYYSGHSVAHETGIAQRRPIEDESLKARDEERRVSESTRCKRLHVSGHQ